MKQQAHETVDYLTTEEDDAQDFFQFADLALTDEQLDEVKGGPGAGWCTGCAVIYGNHNETTVEDEEAETEALNDLEVEDDEQVKGGEGSGVGGITFNHNETVAGDDEDQQDAEALLLDDLVSATETEEQVKGGPSWCTTCGAIFGNHNETTVEDDETETESLADLVVAEEQEVQVRGGDGAATTVPVKIRRPTK